MVMRDTVQSQSLLTIPENYPTRHGAGPCVHPDEEIRHEKIQGFSLETPGPLVINGGWGGQEWRWVGGGGGEGEGVGETSVGVTYRLCYSLRDSAHVLKIVFCYIYMAVLHLL